MLFKNTASRVNDFTRGGQTLLQRCRMAFQIIQKLLFVFIILFILLLGGWLRWGYRYYDYPLTVLKTYCAAQIRLSLWHEKDVLPFTAPDGHVYSVYPRDVVTNPWVIQQVDELEADAIKGIEEASAAAFAVCVGGGGLLMGLGRRQRKNRITRGTRRVSPQQLTRLLKKANQNSPMTLAGVPIVKDSEQSHFLIMGSPGTGKSVCMSELLDQIRAKKQRAIVYDKVGDFVAQYYRPGKDILLNPLDARCPAWNIWSECQDATDYDSLAASLMPLPLSTGDTFWINAARTIFAATARRLQSSPDRSTQKLLQLLLSADLDTLGQLLKGTEAEILVSEKIEKMALSVKSVLSTHLKSFIYLKESETPFSIRDWVKQENDDSWLFVSSRSDKHESLKPLISTWLDIAGTALMSLDPNRDRRIWMSLDELPSLHRLPYLSSIFAESRKFGGCLVATIQSIAQLRDIYGNHAAEAISGLCNTRLFFRTPETQTAEWVSKSLGESDMDEAREGFSYGANHLRDGVSLNRQHVTRPVILSSEIMQLKNLHAYLRLPGDWPITELSFHYREREQAEVAFEERKMGVDEVSAIEKTPASSPSKTTPPATETSSSDEKAKSEISRDLMIIH